MGWKERNSRSFKDLVLKDHVLKLSLLCLFLEVGSIETTMSMVELVDWLGVMKRGLLLFFAFCFLHFDLA